MSFGRACIAPHVGFFKDVLDATGSFLYDSADETSLPYAMKCAIEKRDEILDMGHHNLKLAEQWNWNYVVEETFKIYQMCLSSRYSHPK
jgi:beta-1,4-mannosyltransferase